MPLSFTFSLKKHFLYCCQMGPPMFNGWPTLNIGKKNTIKKVTYLDLLDLHQTIPTRAIKKLMQSGAEKAFRCRLRWVDFVNLSFRPSSFKRISCEIFDCQNFVFFLWNILDFRMFKILKLLILRFSKAPTLGEVFKTQMRFSKASISTVKTFLTFF